MLTPMLVALLSSWTVRPGDEVVVEAARDPQPAGPYVLVLGTAQDGGLPQIGCWNDCCRPAREDPSRRRLVTSLLLSDPQQGQRWLFDCTPDLREQVERAHGHPTGRHPPGARPPLFEGVFLTHAHMGHYTGLMFLGPEAYGAMGLPLYGTKRMHEFLASNGPWDLLVKRSMLRLERIEPGRPQVLSEQLSVETILVPHRDEYSDTCAFLLKGPQRSLLYLPDIDKWSRWDQRIEDWIGRVDYALLDGAFYADGEIPGRSMKDIPHPFIQESMERFASLPARERSKVYFTHLNHTNPAVHPDSEAARAVAATSMHILQEKAVFEL